MAKRLRDYGLQSERLLWPTKGPSHFEEEMGADELVDIRPGAGSGVHPGELS